MQRIARFTRVSQAQFAHDWRRLFPDDGNMPDVSAIPLPRRATPGSAGYDFFAPLSFSLSAGSRIIIPTGIRVLMREGWFLAVFPRSGLGVRYRFRLDNAVGIIDQDYAFSSNEGHILLAMTNEGVDGKTLDIETGKAIAQGIFLSYGIAEDDEPAGIRDGGFGSTTGKGGTKENA